MRVNSVTRVLGHQDAVIVKIKKITYISDTQVVYFYHPTHYRSIQLYLDYKTNTLDDRKCSHIAHGLSKQFDQRKF